MLYGGHIGELELRASRGGGARLRGRFPYGKLAVLSDGGRTGRPRKETIAPRAFGYRVDKPDEDIHLLVGHDYGQPLASKLSGTLKLTDTAEALTFDATISAEVMDTSYASDILALIKAEIVHGISPGFRLPPKRAVEVAEELEDEELDPANGKYRAIIRRVLDALLFEISVVTVPAYDETQVEMRSWDVASPPDDTLRHALNRWRP